MKLDRNGLQFFYRYVLNHSWEWLNIVKPPQVKRLPDILTPAEVAIVISLTRQLRYQVCFLTLYSMQPSMRCKLVTFQCCANNIAS